MTMKTFRYLNLEFSRHLIAQLTSEDGRLTPMKFNRVFDELATQEQVFQQCGVTQLVSRALEGYVLLQVKP